MDKLLFFLILLSPSLYAAEEPYDIFSLSLEELMKVQVTGPTLSSESLKTVPAAVTIFNHQQIQNMGMDYLSELMNIVPGFQSYRSAQGAYAYPFSSRGRRIGYNASEVLVLIDGQRINGPRTGGILDTAPLIPLANIERVEFIRGPGASIYGSNAMMGVINIISRSSENEASIAYGSNNRTHLNLLANQKIKDLNMDFFARFDNDDGQEYQVSSITPENLVLTSDPFDLADLYLKLKWHNTSLNMKYNESETNKFYNAARVDNHHSIFNSSRYITLRQDFSWSSINSWALLSYNKTNLQQKNKTFLPGSATPIPIEAIFVSSESRLQLNNTLPITPDSDLQFGVEFRQVKVLDGYVNASNTKRNIQPKSKRDIIGLYTQYQNTLYNQSHLTFGLRYDNFSNVGSKISPRFAWVQELNEHHSIKLLYGEAFRAPSLTELYLTNNTVLLGNPDLKPETVSSSNLIWSAEWSKINLSAGYFQNHFEDSISQMEIPVNRLQYTNLNGKEHSRGYEFEINTEINEHLIIQVTYTKIADNSEISFREADQLASFTINYSQKNWNANLISSFHDTRDMITNTGEKITLDSYWYLSGKISYSFSAKWNSYLQVKNLADTDILTPPTFTNSPQGIPNRGREVMLGAMYSF